MISKLLVFVSSTSGLQEERVTLRQQLPRLYEVYLFEEDRSRLASPEEHCRRRIEQADVFLGVLGPDYGSPFPGAHPTRSIVEWEHEMASKQSGLETLTFVKELPPGQTRDPRQQEFIDRLSQFRGGLWRETYGTPAELAERARASLERWLAEFYASMQTRRASLRSRLAIPLIAVSVASVATLIAALVSSLASRLTTNAMIGLCATVGTVVMLCGALWLWLSGGKHE